MKIHIKLLTLLLVLLMLTQSTVLSVFAVTPIDIDTSIYQASTKQHDYSATVNSGYRHEVATSLEGTSYSSYYTGNNVYDVFAGITDSNTSTKDKNEALIQALNNLMQKTHTKTTKYDNECKYDAKYTDAEGGVPGVRLIYTNVWTTKSLSGNSTWNREHVWPKSLGNPNLGESGPGADMHQIRPSDCVVNSTRNNDRFGNVTGGKSVYDANFGKNNLGGYSGGGFFEPVDNVKGDVARICLYMYVRYHYSHCQSITTVFQSIDVLLEWCELDPVDTWELGRNEVIHKTYQGNRNVFIDYPELAWLIFNREVPEDMVTPSGEAKDGACDHSWSIISTTQATCTTAGTTVKQCTICTRTQTTTINALGHKWNSGSVTTNPTCTSAGVKTFVCGTCNGTKTETIGALGHSYGEWITSKEPTETEMGEQYRVCSTCGGQETANIPEIGHVHNYSSVVTAPTCTEKGYTTHTCACGDEKVDTYTNALGHKFTNSNTCDKCGFVKETENENGNGEVKFTTTDFINTVNQITSGNNIGENLYELIVKASKIYYSLSDNDKNTVSTEYSALLSAISEYNEEVNKVNEDAAIISYDLLGFNVMYYTVLQFAAYSILNKKYF